MRNSKRFSKIGRYFNIPPTWRAAARHVIEVCLPVEQDFRVRSLEPQLLHTRPAFEVIFASRGKARTQALREHLLKAQARSRKAAGTYPEAIIQVRAMPAHQSAGLQVADYCLWALQRLFTKGEDRFLSLIWPKVALVVDADDISEKAYGTYHTRKRPPLSAESIKNRKVED